MAQVAALCQAYIQLRFLNAEAPLMTKHEQQTNTIRKLGLLFDDDIETLCKVVPAFMWVENNFNTNCSASF